MCGWLGGKDPFLNALGYYNDDDILQIKKVPVSKKMMDKLNNPKKDKKAQGKFLKECVKVLESNKSKCDI